MQVLNMAQRPGSPSLRGGPGGVPREVLVGLGNAVDRDSHGARLVGPNLDAERCNMFASIPHNSLKIMKSRDRLYQNAVKRFAAMTHTDK